MPEQSDVTITFFDENGSPRKPINLVLPYLVGNDTEFEMKVMYHAWLSDSEMIDLSMEQHNE